MRRRRALGIVLRFCERMPARAAFEGTVVFLALVRGRLAVRVVVHGDRAACAVRRRGEGDGLTVERKVGRAEDDEAAEGGQDLCHATGEVPVPPAATTFTCGMRWKRMRMEVAVSPTARPHSVAAAIRAHTAHGRAPRTERERAEREQMRRVMEPVVARTVQGARHSAPSSGHSKSKRR